MKVIPDYPGYSITKDGRVFSKKHNKFLKPRTHGNVLTVILFGNGMPFTKRVSRLVYETYNGETSDFISHKDGNFRNNALANLVAITPSELGIRNSKKIPHKGRLLNRVNIETGQHDRVVLKFIGETAREADSARKCIALKKATAHGNLYYLDGQKKRLEDSLRERIATNQRVIDNSYQHRNKAPMTAFKNNIIRFHKLLEILEGIDDNY